jgi:hypothetical protein
MKQIAHSTLAITVKRKKKKKEKKIKQREITISNGYISGENI